MIYSTIVVGRTYFEAIKEDTTTSHGMIVHCAIANRFRKRASAVCGTPVVHLYMHHVNDEW